VHYEARGCAGCHGGPDDARDPAGRRHAIGTIRPASGQRLGGPLDGVAAPTLRDAWATAPYLHDGSAATLSDAIRAHSGLALPDAEVEALARHVMEMEGGSP
jgi:cytochrome c peroxidase